MIKFEIIKISLKNEVEIFNKLKTISKNMTLYIDNLIVLKKMNNKIVQF